jgi:hypothetical protein
MAMQNLFESELSDMRVSFAYTVEGPVVKPLPYVGLIVASRIARFDGIAGMSATFMAVCEFSARGCRQRVRPFSR